MREAPRHMFQTDSIIEADYTTRRFWHVCLSIVHLRSPYNTPNIGALWYSLRFNTYIQSSKCWGPHVDLYRSQRGYWTKDHSFDPL